MPMLTPFWRFLESRPRPVAVLGEWRQRMADAFEAVGPLLRLTGRSAESYPNPNPHGLPLRVVRHRDGSIVAVCPEGGGTRIELGESDVALHELVIGRLVAQLHGTLNLCPGLRDLGGRITRVGEWEAQPSHGFPVVLLRTSISRELENGLRRCVLDMPRPLIALTPTREHWSSDTVEVLRRDQSILVSLEEAVDFGPQGWLANDTWTSCLDSFRRSVMPESLVPAPAPYAFRKQGQMWVVTFEGQTTHLKDAVGQAYVAQLLADPHKKVFAPDLLEAVTGEPVSAQVSSAGDQADRQTLEDVKRNYLDLEEELEQAKRNNDAAAQERLNGELSQLGDYLTQVKGFGGRTRQASDDADKIRRSITQAIGRTIGWVREDLPAAARHLDNAVKTSLFISYEPEEELPWIL